MDELRQRSQRVVESLTENEALTANLDDEAAQLLLDWGIAYGKEIVQSTAGLPEAEAEEAMQARLQATRRLLRAVNQYFNQTNSAENEARTQSSDATLTLLQQAIEQAAIIFGPAFRKPDAQQLAAFMTQMQQTDSAPRTLIVTLGNFIDQQRLSPTAGQQPDATDDSQPATANARSLRPYWMSRLRTLLERLPRIR